MLPYTEVFFCESMCMEGGVYVAHTGMKSEGNQWELALSFHRELRVEPLVLSLAASTFIHLSHIASCILTNFLPESSKLRIHINQILCIGIQYSGLAIAT